MVARVCVGVLAGVLVVLPVSAASATVGAVPVVGASEAEQRAALEEQMRVAAAAKRGVARELSWWITGLGVDRSVGVSRGAGVKVCVIDSGVDATHQDLVGVRFEGGTDVSGRGGPGGLKPQTAHGTGMAAFIAGRGSGPGRSQGIIGAAPEATIMSVSSLVGLATPQEVMGRAMSYCVAQGAKVISISQAGGLNPSKTRALIEAQEKDVVVVVGAGNDGQAERTAWREAFGALQVGGVTADLQIHPDSNRGIQKKDGLVYGQGNGVCGPYAVKVGEPIPGASPSGGYSKHGGGTSAATAVVSGVVSGVVAAVRSKYPELSAGQVIRRVLATAKRSGGGPVPDEQCGWGVVDAYAAVTADVPAGDKENPLGKMREGDSDLGRPSNTASMGEWDRSYKPTYNLQEELAAGQAERKARAESLKRREQLKMAGVAVVAVAGVLGGVFWWRRRRNTAR